MGFHDIMKRGLGRIYSYFPDDPAGVINGLFKRYNDDPRAFRIHYYDFINRRLMRRHTMPAYRKTKSLFSHFLKLSPEIKQALLGGATAARFHERIADDGGGDTLESVSVHLVQDWKIFTYLDTSRFVGQSIHTDGRNLRISKIDIIDYPCSSDQLNDAMVASESETKIVFVYAYMFAHFAFCDWITKYIASHPETLVAVYFTDSHHMVEFGSALAFVADYLIVSHPDNYQVLSSINPHVYIDKIYLNQWDPRKSLDMCVHSSFLKRDFSLYGTFNYYRRFPWRNRFVSSLSREFGNTVKLNTAEETRSWHAQTGDQALKNWIRFGITLVVPTRYDFTTRVCDALSAGHAVLVPKGCTWLDSCIDSEKQRELGIYRYLDLSSASLHATYKKALERETASDCQERSVRRSEFCLEHLSQDALFESFLKFTRLVLE